MQGEVIWGLFVVQVLIIVFLFALIIYLLRVIRTVNFEKRISDFSLIPIKENEISFFERVNNIILHIINSISFLLSKFHILVNYGKKYEKHISYEDRPFKSGLNYVAIKFLLAFTAIILYIISLTFQYQHTNMAIFLLIFLVAFFIYDIILYFRFKKKRHQIEEDLLKAVIIMNNAFKSGFNIVQAIEIVKSQLDGPIADEFKKIAMDISYGLSLEVVFDRFYNRVKVEDIKYITSSLTMLNRTGGNIVKVFSSIEQSFFDKKKLKDELIAMTSSSIFVFRVLMALPFMVAVFILILNPTYFLPLVQTFIGIIILFIIIIMLNLYLLIIKRLLKVNL